MLTKVRGNRLDFCRPALWLWALGGLAGCASHPVSSPVPAPSSLATRADYVVVAGDTLYSIATRHGLDYRDLARWNGIGPGYSIRTGQTLRLAPKSNTNTNPNVAALKEPVPKPAAPDLTAPSFVWPAQGLVEGVVDRPSGGFGLRIDGAVGSPVRAAAAGKVVYHGTGLRAYGLLVIIRHNDHFLTAYGHNQSLLVKDGQDVDTGAVIGSMGRNAEGVPMLYFEIRRDGRPINPLSLLPAQGGRAP